MKKILIRKGVYETNSSSSHSISLATEDKEFVLDTIYPDQNGRIVLVGGQFGWEWFKHNDALTKANYAYQDDVDKDLLTEVIKEQTGADEVIFIDSENGYIDHDSSGTAPRTKEDLKNFIFNKNSWLFGGNDNQYPDPTFYDVPEIRGGRVILPDYKYVLKIEGLEKTTKFKTYPSDDDLSEAIDSLLSDGVLLTEDNGFIVNNDIFWQISRRRDFYEKSFYISQDYSKGEIIFMRENTRVFDIEEQLKKDPGYEKSDYRKRNEIFTSFVLNLPGICKKVKFTLDEI